MIYLITGNPGAGKSVESISLALQLAKCDPWKNKPCVRPLYVSNVRGFQFDKVPGSLPLPKDQVANWESLPDGSVILIDEVQDVIPQRDKGRPVPSWVQELAKHRHRGFDFVLVTQHPSNMDVFVRRLVGEHRHMRRKHRLLSFLTFFKAGALRITWDRFEPRMEDFLAQRNAVKSGATYDKRNFTLYESTTLDTQKPKLPWQLAGVLVLVVVSGVLFSKGISRFTSDDEKTEAAELSPVADSASAPATGEAATDPVGRWKSLEPRIKGIAASAPMFDAVPFNAPPPRTVCISSGNNGSAGCRCVEVDQGTPVPADLAYCVNAARWGTFHPFVTSGGEGGEPPSDTPSAQTLMDGSATAVMQTLGGGG